MKKLFVFYLVILAFRQDTAAQKIGFSEFYFTNSGKDYTFYIASQFNFGYSTNGPRVVFTYFNKSNDTVHINALYDPTGIVWSSAGSETFDTVKYANPYTDINYFKVSTSCVKEYIDAGGMHVKDTVWNQFDTTFYIGTASIKEQNTAKTMSIYPNPSNGFFVVRCIDPSFVGMTSAVKVYDLLGRLVHQEPLNFSNKEATLKLNIPTGSYILELKDEAGNVQRERLVIQ